MILSFSSTSGIGQSDTEITDFSDISMYVMTPEYGAATQLEKIDMIDYADLIAINKSDKRGAQDAIRDVKKQYQRSHLLFEANVDELPIFRTIASQFNDEGTNQLFEELMRQVRVKGYPEFASEDSKGRGQVKKDYIIPPSRVRYLSEIAENNENMINGLIINQKLRKSSIN